MAVNLSPFGGVGVQFFDNSGNPLTGGKIFTYSAGTTTPQTTYTSAAGSTAHSNPIVLDAGGRVPNGGEIWLTDGLQYKFLLKDANNAQIASYDNITGINSNFVAFTNEQEIQTATASQTVFTLANIEYQPGTNSLSVFVDGVNQYGPGAQYAYVETDSTTVTFVSGLHEGANVKFTTSQLNSGGSTNAALVSYQPPFSGSVATNVQAKLAQYVSVKDFGAVGDGVTDDTVAIQNALNYVNLVGGGCVFIPTGTFKTTATLTVPQQVSIKGQSSESSCIRPTGCDGIEFLSSNAIGPVEIEDFFVYGDSTSSNIGIKFVGDANTATRVTGLRLNRLRVQNFRDAINFRSVWQSIITNCIFYYCVFGVVIRGQCVKIDIENNFLLHNLLGSVTPTATGIVVDSAYDYDPGGATEKRPEDIQLHKNLIFGFPFGIQFTRGLFLTAKNNDLDSVTDTGISVASIGGTLNIDSNWIGLVGTNVVGGVIFDALAGSNYVQKNVTNNEINSRDKNTSYNIYVQANQNNVNIVGNTLNNSDTDIFIQNCGDIVVNGNLCKSTGGNSIYVIGTIIGKTVSISDNDCAGNLTVNPTNYSQIILGQNNGIASTWIRGKSTIAAGATTVTTTYASLSSAPANFASATALIYPQLFVQTPSQNIGAVWGTATDSQVTITCETAPVTDMIVYWEVKGFPAAL